jgi:hypothetical protein
MWMVCGNPGIYFESEAFLHEYCLRETCFRTMQMLNMLLGTMGFF